MQKGRNSRLKNTFFKLSPPAGPHRPLPSARRVCLRQCRRLRRLQPHPNQKGFPYPPGVRRRRRFLQSRHFPRRLHIAPRRLFSPPCRASGWNHARLRPFRSIRWQIKRRNPHCPQSARLLKSRNSERWRPEKRSAAERPGCGSKFSNRGRLGQDQHWG